MACEKNRVKRKQALRENGLNEKSGAFEKFKKGILRIMAGGYTGDLTPQQAWEILRDEPKAQLVDCRTAPEWSFVGVPDLTSLGKHLHQVSWQIYPHMQQNFEFEDRLREAGLEPDAPVLLICRSGGRSRIAAMALSERGFSRCYNVATGFEGDHDSRGHRGATGGWKHDGLPWTQE